MADAQKEPTPGEKALKTIQKMQEEVIPTGMFDYKYIHEKAGFEAKASIIKDKGGPEGAVKYFNSKEGAIDYAGRYITNVQAEAKKGLEKLPLYKQTSLMASYTPDKNQLINSVRKHGADFNFGIAMEEVLPNLLQMQANALTGLASQYDSKVNPEIMKLIGASSYLKNTDNLSNESVSALVQGWNKGGRPIGPDILKSAGLEDRLKDNYKSK